MRLSAELDLEDGSSFFQRAAVELHACFKLVTDKLEAQTTRSDSDDIQ